MSAVAHMRVGLGALPFETSLIPTGFAVSTRGLTAGAWGTVVASSCGTCVHATHRATIALEGKRGLGNVAGACPQKVAVDREAWQGQSTRIGERLGEATLGLDLGRIFPAALNRPISALSSVRGSKAAILGPPDPSKPQLSQARPFFDRPLRFPTKQ